MKAAVVTRDEHMDKILVPATEKNDPKPAKFGPDIDYCNPSLIKVQGIEERRMNLPNPGKKVVTLGAAFSLVKQLIGKDISRVSLPVFINEPLTLLQKAAEYLTFADLLIDAANAKTPERRAMLVATYVGSYAWFNLKRTDKPFTS